MVPNGISHAEVHAVTRWITQTPFTGKSSQVCPSENTDVYQCTYTEVAIAIDAQTGVFLGGHTSDLAVKADVLQRILRLITSKIQLRTNGSKVNLNYK